MTARCGSATSGTGSPGSRTASSCSTRATCSGRTSSLSTCRTSRPGRSTGGGRSSSRSSAGRSASTAGIEAAAWARHTPTGPTSRGRDPREGHVSWKARALWAVAVGGAFACGKADEATRTLDTGATHERRAMVIPQAQGWQFFGPAEGAPREVWGVSQDGTGNIWVAGGDEGLFVLTPGAATLRRFTIADGLYSYTDATGGHGYKAISVAGGPGSTAFVGYYGKQLAEYCTWLPRDTQPDSIVKSGDADEVTLGPAGISVRHIDISTPRNFYPQYPQGREKVHDVFRILYDANKNNVWFGGNHGVALWENRRMMWEHQHAAINGYTARGHYTLLSGDWCGLALDAAGDVWMGGGHRMAKLRYASEGGFWASLAPIIDVWPDAVPADAYSWQRTDDFVQAIAVSGGD